MVETSSNVNLALLRSVPEASAYSKLAKHKFASVSNSLN